MKLEVGKGKRRRWGIGVMAFTIIGGVELSYDIHKLYRTIARGAKVFVPRGWLAPVVTIPSGYL